MGMVELRVTSVVRTRVGRCILVVARVVVVVGGGGDVSVARADCESSMRQLTLYSYREYVRLRTVKVRVGPC